MNVLVTGGAGFIGSHLVERLLAEGKQVFVIDDFSTGDMANLPKNKNLRIFEQDIIQTLPDLSEKIELIYHLASPSCPIIFKEEPERVLNTNDLGTRNILELAKDNDSKFVFTSSSEIYGMQDFETTIEEKSISHLYTLTSRSCYVAAKRFAEELVIMYKKKYNLDTRIVRLFNVYGPRMDKKITIYGRVMPNFLRAALKNESLIVNGDGTQVRSFCWIDDVIEALWLLGKHETFPLKSINIGKSEPISIIDLAKLIIRLTKSKSTINFGHRDIDDTLWRCPNILQAKKLLNWIPKTTLEEGLRKLIKITKANGD